MVKKSEKGESLFYVVCADWEAIVDAKDENEAAAIAIEEANSAYGKNLCLSPSMTVVNMRLMYDSLDAVESTNILYTPKVLANAGMHDLSKKYSKIINIINNDSSEGQDI